MAVIECAYLVAVGHVMLSDAVEMLLSVAEELDVPVSEAEEAVSDGLVRSYAEIVGQLVGVHRDQPD